MADREFRLTFGVQYAREPHPVVGQLIHPDGWVKVMAPTHDIARALVVALFGTAWSNLYEQFDDFDWASTFPLGKTGVLRYAYSADSSRRRVIFSMLGNWEPA